MWLDTGHIVRGDCGKITATRGIDLDGQFVWFVRHPEKRHGYHSQEDDPFRAIKQAEAAWAARRAVRKNWPEVKALAQDLIWGRARLDVRIEDAYASPLCALGIKWFLRHLGLGGSQRVSGRLAALLMQFEPQLGFVIYEAQARTNAHALRPTKARGKALPLGLPQRS